MYKEKLGLIGGFGAYATLNFYKRILESFQSETERNYPHIVIDNDFTMPSRTRALLYNECYDVIVEAIADSMKFMLMHDVRRIVLVCGTAHFFLKDVYNLVPQARERVVDIIDNLGEELENQGVQRALVIAAEGALLKNLYGERLSAYGISCVSPGREHYTRIRYFIECVKKNKTSSIVRDEFIDFINIFGINDIVLGCTELPVLVNCVTDSNALVNRDSQYCFYDPLEVTLDKLKRIMC